MKKQRWWKKSTSLKKLLKNSPIRTVATLSVFAGILAFIVKVIIEFVVQRGRVLSDLGAAIFSASFANILELIFLIIIYFTTILILGILTAMILGVVKQVRPQILNYGFRGLVIGAYIGFFLLISKLSSMLTDSSGLNLALSLAVPAILGMVAGFIYNKINR